MAYKIVPSGPRPAPSPTNAPNATPSRIVSGTRSAVGSVFASMGRHKGKIGIAAVLAGLYFTGYLPNSLRGCSPRSWGSTTYAPVTSPVNIPTSTSAVPAVHADMGPNEAEWIAGFQLLAQADAVDAEWMSAIGRSDHTRDAELADRRTSLTRSCLDHYALSLNKRSDETWVQVIERHSSMDLRRVRQVALSLWRLNELEQARAIMRLYFRDGRWRGLSDAIDADDRHALCDGLELALRDNMIPWNEFSEEDRAEFTRRCPDTINLRVPNR